MNLPLNVIQHPNEYRDGTRVLMLTGRHKDGVAEDRKIMRVAHSLRQFERELWELCNLASEGERIYATAGERCLRRAVREFKARQLDADYEGQDQLEHFYRTLHTRWVAALMKPTSQLQKLWIFDCDTDEESREVRQALADTYDRPTAIYVYPTKSGEHLVASPFDRSKLPDKVNALLHTNPLMLWAY